MSPMGKSLTVAPELRLLQLEQRIAKLRMLRNKANERKGHESTQSNLSGCPATVAG